jgi:hypothetical protein
MRPEATLSLHRHAAPVEYLQAAALEAHRRWDADADAATVDNPRARRPAPGGYGQVTTYSTSSGEPAPFRYITT